MIFERLDMMNGASGAVIRVILDSHVLRVQGGLYCGCVRKPG